MQEIHPETELLWAGNKEILLAAVPALVAEHRALASCAVGAQDLSSSRFHSLERERGRK